MRDPCRVRVTGPLVAYVEGFRGELAGEGYTPASAARQVQLMAHLSRWLASQGLTAGDLTPARVEEFLRSRRADGYTLELSERAVTPLVRYLRGLGVAPWPVSVATTPVQVLVDDYRRYLVVERGLAASTVGCYVGAGSLFLLGCGQPGRLDLGRLAAADVTAFVVRECGRRRVASAKVLVTGLRSLLRFLFLEGYTTSQLASSVPPATSRGGASLPRALGAEVVAALLSSWVASRICWKS